MFSSGYGGRGGGYHYECGYPGSRRYHNIQTQEEHANAQHVIEVIKQARKNLIKKAALDMFYNPELLKNKLEEAVTAYLKEIENKWFRNNGRKRAEELKTKITQANTTVQLISALTEVINAGNEDKDSLKTFIFSCIKLNYCDNKLDNFASQFNKIIAEITEIQMLQEKRLLCWAAFYSENSNFHRLPRDLVRIITVKLN